MEFQFVFPDGTFQVPDIPPYSIVHQGNMNDVPLTVIRQDGHDQPKWPVLPMLQYTNIDTIDATLPRIQISDLGYSFKTCQKIDLKILCRGLCKQLRLCGYKDARKLWLKVLNMRGSECQWFHGYILFH
jgi:hypothetical protein